MIEIRGLLPADYDAVIALWRASEGIVLREVDERAPIERYLAWNPGLSFVACDRGRVVGAVLCGTDGRRGYLQHLAVAPEHQRQGIGCRLAEQAVAALAAQGIEKCHLMVVATNAAARRFWQRLGWAERDDVVLMSHLSTGRDDS
jgi:ribosomal protein S18 acetylase RimI-like enzyme